MEEKVSLSSISSWFFCAVTLTIGVFNLFLVHAVPGVIYMFLSIVYFPPANSVLKEKFCLSIPLILKIILGIAIIWFTLGVSDLGDMIDG